MNAVKVFFCMGGDVRVEPVEPIQINVSPPGPDDKKMETIRGLANNMVNNKLITHEEADKQVTAINNFFQGKMSYAEMRAIAG